VVLQAQTLINYLEELAPKRLAYEWDNVGLQIGSSQGPVKKILVTLDVNERVLEEATGVGADFIVTHHPFIFRPVKTVRIDLPQGRLIANALAGNIRIFAAHTNLDIAAGGVNDALAKRLDLNDIEILRVHGEETLEKIVVFVPRGHEDKVREALAGVGAGWIGNYSHCTFQASGTGTFMPGEGTTPYIGKQGKLERVDEIRLETVYPTTLRKRVIRAMENAHPYEEVAYDIYPLLNEGRPYGLGRIGKLNEPCTLGELCARIKEKLQVSALRVTEQADKLVKKVAVCGGSGGDLAHAALFAGADVLVTGDLKYHEAQDAKAIGISVIDAGHDATERVIVPVLCTYLQNKLAADGYDTDVVVSTVETAPWKNI
jgi:dinuclear metal center YbgI/SA1388 family protein